jgi:hypothetical protein
MRSLRTLDPHSSKNLYESFVYAVLASTGSGVPRIFSGGGVKFRAEKTGCRDGSPITGNLA